MKPSIRIIGGKFKGKKISVIDADGLRPTPNRVRETLFNWLMHEIQHAVCLDAFAGTGGLGFEAYSRGASAVTFIESQTSAYRNLTQAVTEFHSEHLIVHHDRAERYLKQTSDTFDVIFLDPPFAQPQLLSTCVQAIETRDILKPGGWLYTESSSQSKTDDFDPKVWQPYREKVSGQVLYALHQKIMP